jgi:hypothetical protein
MADQREFSTTDYQIRTIKKHFQTFSVGNAHVCLKTCCALREREISIASSCYPNIIYTMELKFDEVWDANDTLNVTDRMKVCLLYM